MNKRMTYLGMALILIMLNACSIKDKNNDIPEMSSAVNPNTQNSGLKIISATYGETDISQVLEQKYRLEPNLFYGEMGPAPKGEKGQIWTISYSVNGEKRILRGRKRYKFLISDEKKEENAFKLLKVLSGKTDVTAKFKKAIAGSSPHIKTSDLSANGKITLLCNDGAGRPTIREYKKNQSIPLSPFRPRNPGNFYVSKASNANDNNLGTKDQPWKTLKCATSFLLPGDTLNITPGTWRESMILRCSGLPGKPITYTGIKGETILRGDIELREWKQDKSNKRVWCRKLDISGIPRYPVGQYYKFYNQRSAIDVTVDGLPLFWNKTSKLDVGSYYVDNKKKFIYIRLPDDSNPNQHNIEAINKLGGIDILRKNDPLCPAVSDYSIKNLVIKRFFYGVFLYGKNVQFCDNTVEWCPREGIKFYNASTHIYKNNLLQWMGTVCGSFPRKSLVENNRMLFGNRYLHSSGWHSAGMKSCVFDTSHSTYKNNEMAYTSALGFWFDTWVNGCKVDSNIVHDNFHAGMEEEISLNNHWINNISYRNRFGIAVHNGNNSVYENNIMYDNYKAGLEWFFMHWGDRKGSPKHIAWQFKRQFRKVAWDCTDSDRKKYDEIIRKYHLPPRITDNVVKRNLLIKNGRTQVLYVENWKDRGSGKIVEPIAELTANNKFSENVFVASSPNKAVSGFNSLADWEKNDQNIDGNIYAKSMNSENVPKWAKTRFAEAKKYLDYPRTLTSIGGIRSELMVKSPYKCFQQGPSPAGLLAAARICESPLLEEKKFSDPMLKAYFIKFKGKRTLVLWRKQGRSSDMAPVLLKNLPENMKIETAWGETLDIPRKGPIASVIVNTWPIYLVDCPKNIQEQSPFKFNYVIEKNTVAISLKNGAGNGNLIIDDKNNASLKCPDSVRMIDGKAEFKLVFDPKSEIASINLRIAGYLDGIYCGGFFKVLTREDKGKKISLDKIKMLPLKGNCDFSNIFGGKIGSLESMPKKIKLFNGVLDFENKCVGFKTSRLKDGEKRPKSISLDLQNRKVKKIVLALACAWAGKENGAPLLAMNLFLDDNNVSSINLRNHFEIRDWWTPPSENQKLLMESSGTYQLWQGDCGHGNWVTVYAYIWENPSPDLAIRSMELKSLNPKTSIGLLGVGIE